MGRRIPSTGLALLLVLLVVLLFAVQLSRPLLGRHAASAGHAFPEGTTSAPLEAGSAHHG
jgi:hypothetical protein